MTLFKTLSSLSVPKGNTVVINSIRNATKDLKVSINNYAGCDIQDIISCMDSTALDIILANLVSNSIKFSENSLYISITIKDDGNFYEISFSDNGCGVNPKQIDRIFEKFNKADTKKKGFGLGLAICKHLVELYGGSICAKCEPGQGSKF